MNYFVFQVSDQERNGITRTALETFNFLVKERNAWGFGPHTANRKAIQAGDKVLFYVTGHENQYFIGSATLKSGAYKDESGESNGWYVDPETLRIDLETVQAFAEPRFRKDYKIEWRPAMGGSSRISEKDFQTILGVSVSTSASPYDSEEEMEFALEKYLEDFIVDNWDRIDFGEKLKLFEDSDGNLGKQYYTGDVGYIDILANNRAGDFIVIELKKGRKNDEVVGQILRYMGWVRQNLAKDGQNVSGLIIVRDRDDRLEYALKEISDKVKVKRYAVSFKLMEY